MRLDISNNLTNNLSENLNRSANQISIENAAQEVRFRCPDCQKLYRTLAGDAFDDIQNDAALVQSKNTSSALPEFDCQSCQHSFFLTKKMNEFGLYETQSNNHVFSECPKCNKLMPHKCEECPSCGVFVEKYQQVVKAENPTLFELNQLWKAVLENFNQDGRHQEFLNACQKKMALSFAFQKYDELRKTMNYDASCEKYLKQIEIRLEQQFRQQQNQDVDQKTEPKRKLSQKIFAWVSVCGIALLTFNKIRPTFPNVNGLVVAITVMSFGLWLVSTQNKNTNIKL